MTEIRSNQSAMFSINSNQVINNVELEVHISRANFSIDNQFLTHSAVNLYAYNFCTANGKVSKIM